MFARARRTAAADASPPLARGRKPERSASRTTVALSDEETVNIAAHQLHACANRIRQLAREAGSAALARQLAAVADALVDRQARLLRGEPEDGEPNRPG